MSRSSRSRRRDTFDIANEVAFARPSLVRSPVKSEVLREYEDRRYWDPEGKAAPAHSFNKPRHRLTLVRQAPRRSVLPQGRYSQDFAQNVGLASAVAFREPSRVLICVRRQRRREVLHAFRRVGHGSGGRPRFNYYSKISCR